MPVTSSIEVSSSKSLDDSRCHGRCFIGSSSVNGLIGLQRSSRLKICKSLDNVSVLDDLQQHTVGDCLVQVWALILLESLPSDLQQLTFGLRFKQNLDNVSLPSGQAVNAINSCICALGIGGEPVHT